MTTNTCRHRWVLDTPTGNSHVSGRCRACGVERTFRAGWDDEEIQPGKWRLPKAHWPRQRRYAELSDDLW
jgi:hypothetical protein